MNRRPQPALPMFFAELTWASWETMLRRSMMIAQGTCTGAEYHRMVMEKVSAVRQTSRLAIRPGSIGANPAGLFLPWDRAATRNAKRLRRQT